VISDDLLLVLIVREAGLRSSLAARLGMTGADLMTADSFHAPRVAPVRDGPVVLIADQQAVDDHVGGSGALAADPRWQRVVIITSDGSTEITPELIRMPRDNAAAAIAALVAEWLDPGA
jgi:hypothetical protein